MEENNQKNESINQSKSNIKAGFKGLFEGLKVFLKELLDFRDDTDHEATFKAITNDIPFKGATAWILTFAVFIASIGLNTNSTAVVIGAMLISPLMGPILGIGTAFAINDIGVFKKSAQSLTTMIVLSLIASFIYFYVFPGGEENTSELLGRTKPDIRDVLIAFFGGLALMVARMKKGTIASVIFGVAIATALMPPLCTAGFGFAKWFKGDPQGLEFAMGALFLFVINTIFIALATFIVIKLFRFPMHKYANAATRKRYATIASIVGIAIMSLAVYTFINTLNEKRVNNQLSKYIKVEIKNNESLQLMEWTPNFDKKELLLAFFNEVPNSTQNALKNALKNHKDYEYIRDFSIKIKGSETKTFDFMSVAYEEKRQELKESKRTISNLEDKIKNLEAIISDLNLRVEENSKLKSDKIIAFSSLAKNTKIRFNDIKEIGFANILYSKDFIKIDTIPQVFVKWNPVLQDSLIFEKELQLKLWIQNELKLDTLFLERNK